MARIIVVEDDPQVRAMLRETLQQEGHDIVEASNGKECVTLYRENPAELVITDIIMPEQDGVETIHSLRREHPGVRIIAISGGSPNIRGDYLLGTANALGAVRAFHKPVDMNELINAIKDVLGS